MSRELQALEIIKNAPTIYVGCASDIYTRYSHECKIIENALKDYEELKSKSIMLYGRTQGITQQIVETICKNYKDVKITDLETEKELKIIKEKTTSACNCLMILKARFDNLDYNNYKELFLTDLTKEEYDLLKGVLL